MADEQKTPASEPSTPGSKKPYTKPNVASESIYEVTALACGKTPGGGIGCTGSTGGVHNS